MDVVGDQLFVVAVSDWHSCLKEIYKFDGMRSIAEEKINALVDVLDVDAGFVDALL